jgi:hypothetical protein
MDSQVSIEIDRPIEQVFHAANECITEWSVTRVSQRAVVHGRGFTKVVFALLGWVFNRSSCKALDNELECLKNFCEARPEG